MASVYCYVSRFSRGAAIDSLVLVDGREARVWTPPAQAASAADARATDADSGASSGSTLADEEHSAKVIKQGAAWIAGQLGSGKGQSKGDGPDLILCLDVDGGRCAWLTSAGGSQSAVLAAVDEAMSGPIEEGITGTVGGSVWAPTEGEPTTDLSVQGLTATLEAPARAFSFGKHASAAATERQRVAVLAMPDLAARLLVDELDSLGCGPTAVTSVWHAMAAAWDPQRADELQRGILAKAAPSPTDSVPSGSVTAVVLVDPGSEDGAQPARLVWSWTRGGALLAAGGQRVNRTSALAAASAATTDGDESLAPLPPPEPDTLELSRADLGRTVSEWLAWSLQLGAAPAQVICIGPKSISCAGFDGEAGLGQLAQTLARNWPGAAATAGIESDPVIASLMRLAAATGDTLGGENAQSALVMLSSRPGRLSRRSYAWMAAAVVLSGVGVGIIGFKLQGSASAAEERIAGLARTREELITSIKDMVPRALNPAVEQVPELQSKLNALLRAKQVVVPERPILTAFARLLTAAGTVPDAKLKGRASVGSNSVRATFAAASDKADALPNILKALRAQPAEGVPIVWEGVPKPAGADGERLYDIRGAWEDPKTTTPPLASVAPSGGTKPPAPPAPKAGPATNLKPGTTPADPAANPRANAPANPPRPGTPAPRAVPLNVPGANGANGTKVPTAIPGSVPAAKLAEAKAPGPNNFNPANLPPNPNPLAPQPDKPTAKPRDGGQSPAGGGK